MAGCDANATAATGGPEGAAGAGVSAGGDGEGAGVPSTAGAAAGAGAEPPAAPGEPARVTAKVVTMSAIPDAKSYFQMLWTAATG